MLAIEWELVLRLGFAVIVGGLIGLNRDLHGKPAGLRTHALVALGTALVVALVVPPGVEVAQRADALGRVIQGVLTGTGFLGAGVILHDARGSRVHGLTTAAAIWVTALIGVGCGAGAYALTLIAVALAFLVLLFGGGIERWARRRFGVTGKNGVGTARNRGQVDD
jgi:putative Mg2+ transporter-C (MgtC) family protein